MSRRKRSRRDNKPVLGPAYEKTVVIFTHIPQKIFVETNFTDYNFG